MGTSSRAGSRAADVDDAMIDQMTGDALLGRRLEAYAAARLSPDLASSARIRARVLATAHRRADLARADAALVVLAADTPRGAVLATRRRTRRRLAPALLAASVVVALAAGSAVAATPGGPLYATRLWVETLTLPSEPSARAVAELARLESRLDELAAADRAGEVAAQLAALEAYDAILGDASARVLLTGDAVAAAALETGIAQNIGVLQALVDTVPERAGAAISIAIERAIARSDAAIRAIDDDEARPEDGTPGNAGGAGSGAGGDGGGPEVAPEPKPTRTPKPTKAPTDEPKATQAPDPPGPPDTKPTKKPQPTKAPVAEPTRTPRPEKPAPPGDPSPGGG